MNANRSIFGVALVLLLAGGAHAQDGRCVETSASTLLSTVDLCAIQASSMETRIREFTRSRGCSGLPIAASEADRLAEEIREMSTCERGRLLASQRAETQAFLYQHVVGEDRLAPFGPYALAKAYRNYLTLASSREFPASDRALIPTWYLQEAAFLEALEDLGRESHEMIRRRGVAPAGYARTISSYIANAGLPEADPRIRLMRELERRAGQSDASPFPTALLRPFADGRASIPSGLCAGLDARQQTRALLLTLPVALHVKAHGFGSPAGLASIFRGDDDSREMADRIFLSIADAHVQAHEVGTSRQQREVIARRLTQGLRDRFGARRNDLAPHAYAAPVSLMLGSGDYHLLTPGSVARAEIHIVDVNGRLAPVSDAPMHWTLSGVLPASQFYFREPAGTSKATARSYQISVQTTEGENQVYIVRFAATEDILALPSAIRIR